MRKLLIGISLFLCLIILIKFAGLKLRVNSEHAGIIRYGEGYYQSWIIYYSDGHTIDENGEWINLLKWPVFHHTSLTYRRKS